MVLDELNRKFEDLNKAIQEANLEFYYIGFLSNAPATIIPGVIFTETDKNGNVIKEEKADDIVLDTPGEIRKLIEWIEEAMTLLKEYKEQADKLENTIDGLIEYAENEAREGEYDNIIGAKAIGHAIEIKFLNGYIPQDRYKQFEKRLKNIRHLSPFAHNIPRGTMQMRPTPRPGSVTNTPEVEEIIENQDAVNSVNLENVKACFRFDNEYFKNQLRTSINICGKIQANYALLEIALEESQRLKTYGQHSIFLTALKEWGLLRLDYTKTFNSVKEKYRQKDALNDSNKQLLATLKDCFKD